MVKVTALSNYLKISAVVDNFVTLGQRSSWICNQILEDSRVESKEPQSTGSRGSRRQKGLQKQWVLCPCGILAKNLGVFCPHYENLPKTNLQYTKPISLAEGISRLHNIESIVCLLLTMFYQFSKTQRNTKFVVCREKKKIPKILNAIVKSCVGRQAVIAKETLLSTGIKDRMLPGKDFSNLSF